MIIKEAYRIQHVYEKDFSNYQSVHLTVDILKQAKTNLFRENDQLIKPKNAE